MSSETKTINLYVENTHHENAGYRLDVTEIPITPTDVLSDLLDKHLGSLTYTICSHPYIEVYGHIKLVIFVWDEIHLYIPCPTCKNNTYERIYLERHAKLSDIEVYKKNIYDIITGIGMYWS